MFRRLWARRFVKITKQTGDGEIVEVTFNDHDDARAQASVDSWVEKLHTRMQSNNDKVIRSVEQAQREAADRGLSRVK